MPRLRLSAWILLASLAAASPAAASKADRYLAKGKKLIEQERYASAEKPFKQAVEISDTEPEAYKGLFWSYVGRYKLKSARRSLGKAVETAKRRAARFKAGKAHALWNRYLADLYSLDVELTILENEKPLSSGLDGRRHGQAFQAALARVKRSYARVGRYGGFISSIDDPIVDKTLGYMLAGMPRSSAAAPAPARKRGRISTPKRVQLEEDEEDQDQPAANDAAAPPEDEGGGAPSGGDEEPAAPKPARAAKAPPQEAAPAEAPAAGNADSPPPAAAEQAAPSNN